MLFHRDFFPGLCVAVGLFLMNGPCWGQTANCRDAAAVVRGLSATPLDVRTLSDKSIVFNTSKTPPSLTPARAFQVTGICTQQVRALQKGLIFLSNGIVDLRGDGHLEPFERQVDVATAGPDLGPDGVHPSAVSGRFLGGITIFGSMKISGFVDYAGIWQRDGRYIVVMYRAKPDGSFEGVHEMMSSILPIRSLEYFPAPDTPAGMLDAVLEDGQGLLLLNIGYAAAN